MHTKSRVVISAHGLDSNCAIGTRHRDWHRLGIASSGPAPKKLHWQKRNSTSSVATSSSDSSPRQPPPANRAVEWKKCDLQNGVLLAHDRGTRELVALVGVTISFDAIAGGGMEDVEAVGNLRAATAVFDWKGGGWTNSGPGRIQPRTARGAGGQWRELGTGYAVDKAVAVDLPEANPKAAARCIWRRLTDRTTEIAATIANRPNASPIDDPTAATWRAAGPSTSDRAM